MEQTTNTSNGKSPSARIMAEAIELAIEGRSPYPDSATFVDADEPGAGRAIERAADEGRAVILVSADGSTRTLHSEHARH